MQLQLSSTQQNRRHPRGYQSKDEQLNKQESKPCKRFSPASSLSSDLDGMVCATGLHLHAQRTAPSEHDQHVRCYRIVSLEFNLGYWTVAWQMGGLPGLPVLLWKAARGPREQAMLAICCDILVLCCDPSPQISQKSHYSTFDISGGPLLPCVARFGPSDPGRL